MDNESRVALSYARTHLSEVVRRAEAGENITITKGGRDVARIIADKPSPPEQETAQLSPFPAGGQVR